MSSSHLEQVQQVQIFGVCCLLGSQSSLSYPVAYLNILEERGRKMISYLLVLGNFIYSTYISLQPKNPSPLHYSLSLNILTKLCPFIPYYLCMRFNFTCKTPHRLLLSRINVILFITKLIFIIDKIVLERKPVTMLDSN